MTYPRRSSTSTSGIIVADVMLALALSALFVSGMTSMSLEARGMYERARTRSGLLAAYEAHAAEFAGMMPYESRARTYAAGSDSDPVQIDADARWYGNDRIETSIIVRQKDQSVAFQAVRKHPFDLIDDAAGTPLCSARFSRAAGSMVAITPIILPIDALLPLTDIEIRGSIAYLSADSSVASDPDLIIADISDRRYPRVISSLSTGPGLRSISLAGAHVFAAAASTAAQLHVIRLDSLASPVLAKRYQLALPASTTAPAMGSSIYYDRGTIYLGTEKWEGNEFSAIDVSVPNDPKIVGGYDIGSKVTDIVVREEHAYVSSASQSQIQTFDISDPASPMPVMAFAPSGWERQEGKIVSWFEDSLAAGRTAGGFDVRNDHEAFLWPYGSSTPLSMNIPGGVYGIIADRDRLYLATRNIDKELTIVDRSLASSSAAYYPLPVAPQAMTCDGDRLYILAHNAPAIYEIALSPQ